MSDSSSDYGKQYDNESWSNEAASLTKAMLNVNFPQGPSFGHGGPVKALRGMMPPALGPQGKRTTQNEHFNNVNSQIGSIIYQSL